MPLLPLWAIVSCSKLNSTFTFTFTFTLTFTFTFTITFTFTLPLPLPYLYLFTAPRIWRTSVRPPMTLQHLTPPFCSSRRTASHVTCRPVSLKHSHHRFPHQVCCRPLLPPASAISNPDNLQTWTQQTFPIHVLAATCRNCVWRFVFMFRRVYECLELIFTSETPS